MCVCRRWGMYAPGIVALAVAVIVLLFMKESPETQGFAPINAGDKPKDNKPRECPPVFTC